MKRVYDIMCANVFNFNNYCYQTTENNLSCDVDFLKGVIVENLSQEKAYSIENITEAVNRIPEFFSIVMHEKMLNIN